MKSLGKAVFIPAYFVEAYFQNNFMFLSKFLSLRQRLNFAFTFIIILTVVVTGIISSMITTNHFAELALEQDLMHAREVAPLLETYYAQTDSWQGLDEMLKDGEGMDFVSEADDRLRFTPNFFHDHELIVVTPDGSIIYKNTETAFDKVDITARNNKIPLYDDRGGGQIVGYVLVGSDVGVYTEQQARFLDGVTQSLLISGIVSGFFALIVAAVVSGEVTAPVSALTLAAQKLANGDTTEPLPVDLDDEVGKMSVAFNQMAEALQKQRESRQQLVHDLAHELGTPLSVIQIEMKALRDGQQDIPQTYRQVERELDLLRNLVNDLNLLTAGQAQLQLQKEPIELSFLVQRAVERWRPQAETAQIAIHYQPPEQTVPFIKADISRLIQVLGNLINNALRHTFSKGSVTVSCEMMMLQDAEIPEVYAPPAVAHDRPWIVTTVQDTGEGIPAADLAYVFERFFRTDEARLRHRGRGLGLSIVKKIVEAHEGYVWVDSTLGEGSTFGFCLPVEG